MDMKNSYVENEFLQEAKEFYETNSDKIVLPKDFRCRSAEGNVMLRTCDNMQVDDVALDIGDESVAIIEQEIIKGALVIWNGPLGYYEDSRFNESSIKLSRFISGLDNVVSIIGGGDTLAALQGEIKGNRARFSYMSTSGGAFLEFIENVLNM